MIRVDKTALGMFVAMIGDRCKTRKAGTETKIQRLNHVGRAGRAGGIRYCLASQLLSCVALHKFLSFAGASKVSIDGS